MTYVIVATLGQHKLENMRDVNNAPHARIASATKHPTSICRSTDTFAAK